MTGHTPVDIDLVARALLARVAALLHLGAVPETVIDDPVFGPEAREIGGRTMDSLETAEVIVILEQELGTRLLDADDPAGGGSLRTLARVVAARCNRGALDAFCRAWAPGVAPP